MIQRYVSKISGRLLDRIDIHIEVPAVKYKELRSPSSSEDSAAVRQRVIDARNQQTERYRADKKKYSNAQMMPKMIRRYCAITTEGEKRTIADLDAAESIEPRYLSEAIQYRTLDRSYWA